jgi:GT2 family glycosyltransferase
LRFLLGKIQSGIHYLGRLNHLHMISIIVLHHNKASYSNACLESLLRSTTRPLEVVNVDNGSRDETPGLLTEWSERANAAGIETKTLAYDTNIGAIRGRNEALRVARGEHLVFLDNDTLITQTDWLDRLREFLAGDERRAAVAPKLLFPWEPFQIECCGAGVSQRGRIQYIGRGQERNALVEPFVVQCAISAAWMMRRAVIDKIGALDDVYSPVQYEDLDWCYRAREAGYEIWALPAVELLHFEHTTTAGSDDINFKYVTTKNGVEFKRRWTKMFAYEDGPTEEEAKWQILPKKNIEELEWQTLLP